MPPSPANPAALLMQATAHHQAGATALAERLYSRILATEPHHPQAGYNLALLLAETGRPREARKRLESLIRRHPDLAPAHYTLARLFEAEGQAMRALPHLRRAQMLDPGQLDPYLDLIRLLGELPRMAEARDIARLGLRHFPGEVTLITQIGIAALRNGHPDEALQHFAQALALTPDDPKALYNLANAYDALGALDQALAYYAQAQARDPQGMLPPVYMGHILLRMGDVDGAIAEGDAWLKTHPDDAQIVANRLMAAQYQPGITAAELHRLHLLWDRQIGLKLRPARERHMVRPDPERKLRVGVVSADLRAHAVGFLTIRAFEGLDRDRVALVAYSGRTATDPVAARFRACMPQWRETEGWDDIRLADAVRQDRIDVLIDLSGHTANGPLQAFARRPAPVQITWAGYFGTTGASAMDGLIADRFLVPRGEEQHYVEKVLRLPDGYLCLDTSLEAPEIVPLPAGDSAPLIFAAFHNPAKINRDVVQLWARILHRLPGTRIDLTAGGYAIAETRARVQDLFAKAGIGDDRLRFTGHLDRQDYLRRLGMADVALDPFPYSGGAITCDSLWMGLPVVTWPGHSFAGRHSQSHLNAAGLTDTIADSADAYVAIVERLNADRTALAARRSAQRAQIAASPLADADRFAAHLHDAWRGAWRIWCATQGRG